MVEGIDDCCQDTLKNLCELSRFIKKNDPSGPLLKVCYFHGQPSFGEDILTKYNARIVTAIQQDVIAAEKAKAQNTEPSHSELTHPELV